jgi:hypothetical protein
MLILRKLSARGCTQIGNPQHDRPQEPEAKLEFSAARAMLYGNGRMLPFEPLVDGLADETPDHQSTCLGP